MKSIKSKIKELHRRMSNTREKKIIKEIFKNSKELKNSVLIYMVEYSSLPVYEVITLTKHYIVKTYPKDTDIFDVKKYLKEQVKYVEELNNKGVNVAMPLKINNNYVYETEEYYFLVYDYIKWLRGRGLYNPNMDLERLADLLIQSQTVDKKLKLDFFYKKVSDYGIETIKDLVEKNNFYVEKAKAELTICHNDFRPPNILWTKENTPYLIDFDTSAYAYKYANLIEAAINFSYDNVSINFDVMEKIFSYYFKKVKDKGDFDMAFYLALNGKITWLNHMIEVKDPAVEIMINLLKYVESCKEKIKELYLNA